MSRFSSLYLQEIVQNVETESQNPFLKEYDCFVLAILSHGNRGVIYGIDTERVSSSFVKVHSHQAKAKISFDVCRSFFEYFRLSFDLFFCFRAQFCLV